MQNGVNMLTNEALRLLRVYHDLKLYEMAKLLGISSSYLSEIEKGEKDPSLKILDKYADAFNISTSAILLFSEKLAQNQKSIKAKIAQNIIKIVENVEKITMIDESGIVENKEVIE